MPVVGPRTPCQPPSARRIKVPQDTCGVELEPLVEQLVRDMQHWKPQSIGPDLLDRMRAQHRDDPVRVSLAIVNRTVWFLRPLGTPRSPMVISIMHDLQELADTHPVPDVEFVLNVDDYPFVRRAGRAADADSRLVVDSTPKQDVLPLFGHYQTTEHNDILCPGGSFRDGRYDQLMLCGRSYYTESWPWREKARKAFWQGHPYCGEHVFRRCSRYLLPHLSHQNASALLDAGLTFYETKLDPYLKQAQCEARERLGPRAAKHRGRHPRCAFGPAKPGDLPRRATPLTQRPWVPIDRHARYRFLLQLDGHSCSWRMQFLLATNSAVLKQHSYYWEYYYTALTPHVHFVPFWERAAHDLLEVLPNVSAPEHDAAMRRVGRRGQAFAHRHLNAHARQCYWRALLALYAARLAEPPSLAKWPRAVPARHNRKEGWYGGQRAEDRVRWDTLTPEWRRRDDTSLREAVRRVESMLAAAPPHHRFTSSVERRSPRFPR